MLHVQADHGEDAVTVAATNAGRVRGRVENGIHVFRGIPFAAGPFGANRFKPPRPVAPWDGERDALEFGPGVPQPSLAPDPSDVAFFNPPVTGEDCLNLNVWTPEVGGGGLPVMVWIHGGGYISGGGSSPIHDGRTWARDGVVYVSINYRMHVDGFVHFGDDTVNLGLQDQVAALRWVHDNVAAFGGDPGNVTIFGQSGGGVSVMHLLAMPSAAGLFRRAIVQSGSTLAAADHAFTDRVVKRQAEILGVDPTAQAVATVPLDQLLTGVGSMAMEYLAPVFWGSDSFLISPYRPLVDGTILPADVETAMRAGASAGVDVMAGATRDECTFAMAPLGMLVDDPPAAWADAALGAFGVTRGDLEIYRTSRPTANAGELIQAAWTDWAFRMPTLRMLDAHSAGPAATYAYEFTWPSPVFPAQGAVHAIELPFVNDMLDEFVAGVPASLNPLGPTPPAGLAATMHRAWIDFATTGDPGWPAYDTRDRAYMRFDAASAPARGWGGPERKLWT